MSIHAVNISDLVFREVGIVKKECMRLHLRLYVLMLIFATLDGSEPTVESDIYEGPVYLTENTCVKAVVTDKDNQILETPTVKNFLVNKATGCTYTLSTDAWSLDWVSGEAYSVYGWCARFYSLKLRMGSYRFRCRNCD